MPQYISGKQLTMKVLVESLLYASGALRLIHDGGKTDSRYYTRRYEILLKGQKTGVEIKFVYNDREDWAEIEITGYNLVELKLQERLKGVNVDRIQVSEAGGNSPIRARDEKARGVYYSP